MVHSQDSNRRWLLHPGARQNWGSLVHWPSVQQAKFTCPSFLIYYGSEMVNLRTLDLSLDDKYLKYANYGSTHSEHLPQCCLWTHGHHDVANAVLSVPRIENLKIRNSIQSIPVIISHHGEKLRKLSIFQDQELKFDAFSSHIPRVTPSEELLLQIARDCPKLTDLSLDAPSDSIAVSTSFRTWFHPFC